MFSASGKCGVRPIAAPRYPVPSPAGRSCRACLPGKRPTTPRTGYPRGRRKTARQRPRASPWAGLFREDWDRKAPYRPTYAGLHQGRDHDGLVGSLSKVGSVNGIPMAGAWATARRNSPESRRLAGPGVPGAPPTWVNRLAMGGVPPVCRPEPERSLPELLSPSQRRKAWATSSIDW